MNELRTEITETIAAALVDLRPIAQPRELGELVELAEDARDAESEEQLRAIEAQARSLIKFCEARRQSQDVFTVQRRFV